VICAANIFISSELDLHFSVSISTTWNGRFDDVFSFDRLPWLTVRAVEIRSNVDLVAYLSVI